MKEASRKSSDEQPQLRLRSRAAWRRWLEKNHAGSSGVWLCCHRKSSGLRSIEYRDAVEEALCFGWIDSIVKSVDETTYIQLYTPRKPKSVWSRSNKERVERLTASGLMAPAGLEKVEIARRNGTWESLDAVEALQVPDDLRRALARNHKARKGFDRLTASKRKALLYHIHSAKRPDTRERRIQLAIDVAEGKAGLS